jgi:hypothetical protein
MTGLPPTVRKDSHAISSVFVNYAKYHDALQAVAA